MMLCCSQAVHREHEHFTNNKKQSVQHIDKLLNCDSLQRVGG